MRKITLWDRLRYAFDNTVSRGPAGLVIWLAAISIVVIALATLAVVLLGADTDENPLAILWDILFQTLVPNPVDPKAGSPVFLGVMLSVTVVSLFLVSIFIGILTNEIDHRIQNLRKGFSLVIEQNHTLILGWSPQIFTVISELVEANANQSNPCVVILADQDKVAMEDEIHARVPRLRNTRVVCRTGSPLDPAHLLIVNPNSARSIIVLAPESDDPDTSVIKTILALTNNAQRKKEKYHIVAQIREARNLEVAEMVGQDEVELILASDLISRITVQSCRQSGLSVVYTELLNFEGDEIYFKDESALVGRTFGDALLAYEDSAVIGLQTRDGRTRLNPPMGTRIVSGDKIIAVTEDDDTIRLSGKNELEISDGAIQLQSPSPRASERTLILGWNHQGSDILNELDGYVAAGSETMVVANGPEIESKATKMRNQAVVFHQDDPTDRRVLDGLRVAEFNHVIVLSNANALDAQHADAQTLITLLHLRDLSERAGKEFSIVSEMLDVRNRELAEVTRADDFIVSDQLISLMLAQVSENKFLNTVFDDLFSAQGSEIYLKSIEKYVQLQTPLNFYTLVKAAQQRGEIAFGYRLRRDAHVASKAYGIVINPDKSRRVTFEKGDKLIVLAEAES